MTENNLNKANAMFEDIKALRKGKSAMNFGNSIEIVAYDDEKELAENFVINDEAFAKQLRKFCLDYINSQLPRLEEQFKEL